MIYAYDTEILGNHSVRPLCLVALSHLLRVWVCATFFKGVCVCVFLQGLGFHLRIGKVL